MLRKVAVLWSLDERSLPVGIVVEGDEYVLVDVPNHYGIDARQRGEYEVLQPDLDRIRYRPGDPGYFDQVLLELSRTFAVNQRYYVEADTPAQVVELLRREVLEPLEAAVVGEYESVEADPAEYELAFSAEEDADEDLDPGVHRMPVGV